MDFTFDRTPAKTDRASRPFWSRTAAMLRAAVSLVADDRPAQSRRSAPTVAQLLLREQDNRRFLEQIARNEPLPNVLKHLVDIIERHNRALRACFTITREGRVCYAVAPTLGGQFAAAVEDVTATELHRLGQAPIVSNPPAVNGPTVIQLASHPDWAAKQQHLLEHAIKACWSVPIVSENEPLGTLSVYTHLTSGPSADDAELLETIAAQAAIAIEHQQLIERQVHQTLHDPLTSLPNRALLEDRFQNAIDRAQRGNWRVGLFVINIDRFKLINDSLGHGSGDELLRQIGERLRLAIRVSDTVARISADEFAVVVPEMRDRDAAEPVAAKFLSLLAAPFTIAGREVVCTSSLGAAIFPEHGADIAALQRAANRALSRAKTLGRNGHAFYTPELGQLPVESAELDLQAQLRRAIQNNEMSLRFQPQVDHAGRMVAVEALLRWSNSRLGNVPPSRFIPVAEQTGLIVPIGEWVLREACRAAQNWQPEPGEPALRIAVNVSALQFAQPTFLTTVKDVLAETALDPRRLELELTESLLMQNTQDAAAKLSALGNLGVSTAIDDFGTGYSSLGYLRRLPIDTLKIDRSFVLDVTPENNDESATAVISAILSMAKSLGLNVVAEGVETETQRDFLIHHGCPLMQGYLYSRPVPAAEIEKLRGKLLCPAAIKPMALSA
ncbi:MAG TPA: GGDEF domain-containing protein [Tepidisphaeraceae bacterium]|jgi:diguanylate cyclase (GGDEF)-like protein|nr:GGDEF domain-containing protein [Tepidisphaeraceae bacterium]